MENNTVCSSLSEISSRVNSLNLDPIKIKLMDSNEGEGWSREKADAVETQYKRFLVMSVCCDLVCVPTKDIDHFWHQHILDTAKYREDCQAAFGFFLDHFPYFGMRGEEDALQLQESFRKTSQEYEFLYGESYTGEVDTRQQTCGICGGTDGACNSIMATVRNSTMQVAFRPSFN